MPDARRALAARTLGSVYGASSPVTSQNFFGGYREGGASMLRSAPCSEERGRSGQSLEIITSAASSHRTAERVKRMTLPHTSGAREGDGWRIQLGASA